MTIEEALYSKLAATTGLTDIVGLRIYPTQAPQTAVLPYLTFQQISGKPEHVLGSLPTLQVDRFQFSGWAGTYKQAKQISAAVKTALRGFTGLMGGASGVTVSACLDDSRIDAFEGDSKDFHSPIDFMIYHDAV